MYVDTLYSAFLACSGVCMRHTDVLGVDAKRDFFTVAGLFLIIAWCCGAEQVVENTILMRFCSISVIG